MKEKFALVTQILVLITVGVGLYTSMDNLRRIEETKAAVEEIHISINSRMDELLALTAAASHAAGVKEQQDTQEE